MTLPISFNDYQWSKWSFEWDQFLLTVVHSRCFVIFFRITITLLCADEENKIMHEFEFFFIACLNVYNTLICLAFGLSISRLRHVQDGGKIGYRENCTMLTILKVNDVGSYNSRRVNRYNVLLLHIIVFTYKTLKTSNVQVSVNYHFRWVKGNMSTVCAWLITYVIVYEIIEQWQPIDKL